ncbi:SanA/YdcF family protein [Flectobacillus rivi]|uniref:ElyC/SanA/YdcF family protein n=1 Tax=Flectobacillus rivi TaxID=2984209 RepID=A0ABT6Z037_9BACT|nr:ElyC/SanA/YdcF family protein [Flectobacillus rivi]MDI9873971.1 ElyC/SanA/YdcF family protein [Flectobacillus rivi]
MKSTLEIAIREPLNFTRFIKRVIKGLIALGFMGIILVLMSNIWIVFSTENYNYYNFENLPSNDFALVLGTSKNVTKGKENLFFRYRIEAAARLYHEGKVKYLILSGNHDSIFYNEPADMRQALLKLGVPYDVMILDFAGFRTYDSIVRCKKVFNQQKFTIVSQPTHNARALFLAQHLGVDAVAFAAQDVPSGYKTYLREYLARPKAILDVYFLESQKYN